MDILGSIREALTEGFIFKLVSKLWDRFFGGIAHDVVKEYVKKQLNPKSLDDENLFSLYLAKAKASEGKKSILRQAIKELQDADRANNTDYVKHFRIIVALDATGGGTIATRDKWGKVIITPDPSYQQPGITILEEMCEVCTTKEEFILAIMVTGAIQDAPFGTIDELMHWIKKHALPIIWSQLTKLPGQIDGTCEAYALKITAKTASMPKHQGLAVEILGEGLGGLFQRKRN